MSLEWAKMSMINAAINSERERCAKIADDIEVERDYFDGPEPVIRAWKDACAAIASKIREGK